MSGSGNEHPVFFWIDIDDITDFILRVQHVHEGDPLGPGPPDRSSLTLPAKLSQATAPGVDQGPDGFPQSGRIADKLSR